MNSLVAFITAVISLSSRHPVLDGPWHLVMGARLIVAIGIPLLATLALLIDFLSLELLVATANLLL